MVIMMVVVVVMIMTNNSKVRENRKVDNTVQEITQNEGKTVYSK
jgi:hypothetical protein